MRMKFLYILAALLFSCSNPAGGGGGASNGGGAGSGGSTPVQSETPLNIANLTGTWKQVSNTTMTTPSNGSQTFTRTVTLTINSDSTYIKKTASINSALGLYQYMDEKGSLAVSSGYLAFNQTDSRGTPIASTSTPYPDDVNGWGAQTQTVSQTSMISNGRLYGPVPGAHVYKATGSTSGIVGTWTYNTYNSANTNAYGKSTMTIDSFGNANQSTWQDSTGAFTGTPSTYSAIFTDLGGSVKDNNGNVYYIVLAGVYFVVSQPATQVSSMDNNCWIKQ